MAPSLIGSALIAGGLPFRLPHFSRSRRDRLSRVLMRRRLYYRYEE
jgi:hypothetical protein